MAKPKKTKTEQAFELFDKGCTTTSPELKALIAKSGTRNVYVSRWRKARGIKPDENPPTAIISKIQKKTVLPKGESVRVIETPHPIPTAATKQTLPQDVFDETRRDGEGKDLEEGEDSEHEGDGTGEDQGKEPSNGEGKILTIRDQKIIGVKTPTFTVAGAGLDIHALISVKTMFLYEQARNTQMQLNPDPKDELSLGDFIDTCVEDFFQVRGQDAGMVKLRR